MSSELNVKTVRLTTTPPQSLTHHAAIRRVEVGNEAGQGRDSGLLLAGPSYEQVFFSFFSPQLAMLAFVALLSEGLHGPADPRQNIREDPVLLVPVDRFVQAP